MGFRVPWQMMWTVGFKPCKRKDCATDHPKSKRPPGIWKTIWPGLTPFKLRLTIHRWQTASVSYREGLCVQQALRQHAVVMVMPPFGQGPAAAISRMISLSAPCFKCLSGNHFCGGPLKPPNVADKWWWPCKWWGLLNNGNREISLATATSLYIHPSFPKEHLTCLKSHGAWSIKPQSLCVRSKRDPSLPCERMEQNLHFSPKRWREKKNVGNQESLSEKD